MIKNNKRESEEWIDIENKIVKEIKKMASCLNRVKAGDWNKFLDVVLK